MAEPSNDHKRLLDDSAHNTTTTTTTAAATTSQSPQSIHRSPKRKESEAHVGDSGGDNGKKKRRKVNHACVYCRRSHMTCDLQRPCARCVKRDIGHLCHDEPRDPPKRNKSEAGMAEIAPAPDPQEASNDAQPANGNGRYRQQSNGDMHFSDTGNGAPQIAQPRPISPTQLHHRAPSMNSNPLNFDWNNTNVQNQFQDMHHLHPGYLFNTSEVTNEYNLLNDFLSNSLLDEGAVYSGEDAATLLNDPLLSTSSVNALTNSMQQNNNNHNGHHSQQQSTMGPPPQAAAGNDISRPSSTFPVDNRARDKFYMTAADPAGLSSAESTLR